MIRDTSTLIQEIAAASQEQMAAIREINVGVSQLEEVVQQNAAASHQLSATAIGSGLAVRQTLQHEVDFFQLDTSGNGWTGGTGAQARSQHGAAVRAQAHPVRPLPAPGRRAGHGHGYDGHHGIGHGGGGGPAHPAPPAALARPSGARDASAVSTIDQFWHLATGRRGG